MQQRTLLLMTFCVAMICADTAMAEGPIRKWLKTDNSLPTSSRSFSDWKMPGGRVVEGTQNAMSNARDRLAFWKKEEPRESNPFIEGTGRFFRPDLAEREQNNARKPFSFVRPATWLEPVEEPKPGPQSVHDWIGQPRPGFE